jgi:phosphoribosylamine--glycine ligase
MRPANTEPKGVAEREEEGAVMTGRYRSGKTATAADGRSRAAASPLPAVDHFPTEHGEIDAGSEGTRLEGGRLLSAGGRVLNVTALGNSLADALARAYETVAAIDFPGAHYRHDIGRRLVGSLTQQPR